MNSVSTWTDSNSRADLVIEDVRIADGAKTKDVTIVMESTDAGNVDYGVYFDQHSLRNASSGNTTLEIRIMDTGAAGKAATAATPLLNNPYDQFKLGLNGVLTTIQLDKVAVAAADTYPALLAVFQAALAGSSIVVAFGADFTVIDPLSGTNVTGKSIVLTGGAGSVITPMTGSGWYNTTSAPVPPDSNIYTTYNTGSSSTTELVTSTIVLDDVGRGSTGGDLVVGGMSVGATSTSRGVERFEIEVRDNSKLQTINSTNDALREVVIKNGTTTNTDANQGAYDKTVTNAGNLTVNGNANVTNAVTGQTAAGTGTDAMLSGIDALHHGNYGFTDVRLIDASAMTGKLALTAQVTTASLAKYVNLADTQSNPAADVAGAGNVNYNVKGANFIYTGGANADTFNVVVDSAVAASTTLTGQSDFSMVIDGGAGADTITLDFGGQETAAWVVDQRQNKNITINGGDGDDTIKTPGNGDVIINAGAGSDTVYTDNLGNKATWVVNAANTLLTDLQTNAATSVFMYKGQLVVSFSGADTGGGVSGAAAGDSVAANFTNGFEVVVDIPTGTNYEVTQLHLNQAIKAAINDNAVLKKLAVAKDGPAGTLTITSLVDGLFAADDLSMTIRTQTLTASEETGALTALKLFSKDSTLVAADVSTTNTTSAGTLNAIAGLSGAGAGAGSILGTTSTTVAATAEVATVTVVANSVLNETQIINGVTFTSLGGAGASAGNLELAMETMTSNAGYTVSGAYGAGWTVGAGAAGTVVFTSTSTGNVADLVLTGTDATPSTIATTQGAAATTAIVTATGSAGTADTDNTIDLGAGTSDVVVLSTSTAANETIKFTGSDLGLKTIVNFQDGDSATEDVLDFTSYLTSKTGNAAGTSNSVESETRIVTTLAAGADLAANSVKIISGVTFSATETWAGLTAANFLAAVNSTNVAGAADWGTAGLAVGTIDALDATYTSTAGANYLVGGVAKAIVMVENTGNEGEYKVFELTYNGLATGATAVDFSSATLVGIVDFGNSVGGLTAADNLFGA